MTLELLTLVRWTAIALLVGTSSASAQRGDKRGEDQLDLPEAWREAPAEPLTPEQALRAFELEKGYRIEVVAAEPAIQDPVAMAFDAFGRLWVVEMRGYMNDIRGLGEDDPVGRVSMLEDRDSDGYFETANVFLDGLSSPRVITPFRNGVLVTDGHALVHVVDIDGDSRGDKRTVVDPSYIESGNVEHSPNGMLLGLDNWFYNAKSKKRYRFRGGEWIIEGTEYRGQWGISKDDHGRLYYNYNWDQLRGDFVPPNYLIRNPNHTTVAGLNLPVAVDQRVYPIRRNTGVNRGYREGVLDERGRLHAFASACAPHVYRGYVMSELRGNVFVCGPGANILKRNELIPSTWSLTSRHAYSDRDFLASTDERFRPVNLADGPDGALYLVDFYRGIIQHKDFMTTHLRNEILSRDLETPIHWGRIYRIMREDAPTVARANLADLSSEALVEQLEHAQGWRRDTAQRLLIEKGDRKVMPLLRERALNATSPLAKIHALWTLEGLGEDSAKALLPILKQSRETEVTVHAVRVLEQCCPTSKAFHQTLKTLIDDGAPEVRLQIALTVGNLPTPERVAMLVRLARHHGDEPLMRDAVLSSAHRREVELLRRLWKTPAFEGDLGLLESLGAIMMRSRNTGIIESLLETLESNLAQVDKRRDAVLAGMAVCSRQRRYVPFALTEAPTGLLASAPVISVLFSWPGNEPDAQNAKKVSLLNDAEAEQFREGGNHYAILCAGCHGSKGAGIEPLAPPLRDSEWVLGPEDILIRIILNGLEDPCHVNGTRYAPPKILPNMPPLSSLSDDEIAAVLTYVRRTWGHDADLVTAATVSKVRSATVKRRHPWTEKELLELRGE